MCGEGCWCGGKWETVIDCVFPDDTERILTKGFGDTKSLWAFCLSFGGYDGADTNCNYCTEDVATKLLKACGLKNYNNDIIDMMNMHHVVSQKITRSKETWLLNGEMIKNNNGFVIKVIYKKKIISFSLFFFNNEEAIYFSSCTDRKYFKDFINITHKSIYHSINYLKKNGCKKLTLGECKTIYSSEDVTQKEKNIQKFKSSFGGDIYINFYLKKLDPDLIDLYLK